MNETRTDIVHTIRSFFNKTYNCSINGSVDELFRLSSALGVASIIGYTLNKSNINNANFEKAIFKSINKYERLSNARKEIDELFNDSFKYLYIKGLTISKYYDEPYLRYSADLDIVVEEKQYETAYELLLKKGYKIIRRDKQEITLVNNNGIMIDLHRYYTLDSDNFELLYKDCFNDTHELDINYNYVFNLIHCLKHFRTGILSYKFFVDLYYLRSKIDNNITQELLKSLGLIKFNDCLNSYLDCILGNKDYDNNDLKIENFIFDYANDLGNKNRVLINSYGKSKVSYMLSRLFIPYELICEEYPILKKHKVLLPIYYVKRIVRISSGYRAKYAFEELRNSSESSKDKIAQMHQFINDMGAA